MEPPVHVWTPGQTVDLVEYILKDPSLASSFLNPQVVDELRIPKQKKLCLQLLQRTEWMVWMRKEEWVVHGKWGLRPTEKWGDDSPVKDRLRWLQMEHIRLCTRLNNFASVRALGRDSPERRIWDEYRKKGQHAWYFTYHKMWYEHSPAALRAREAASHPHALAASASNTGRGGTCVDIVGNTAPGTTAAVEEEDDIVIISETIMVDGAGVSDSDLATGHMALSATNLGKRLNRDDQNVADRLKRKKQTRTVPLPTTAANATSVDPIVIDIDDDEEAFPGPTADLMSTTTVYQSPTLASRIGGPAVTVDTPLALRIGVSSSTAKATSTMQRVSLASRIGISSSAVGYSTVPRQRIPLASRLDQRPPTPPRQISRSPSDSHSSTRPSLSASTTATPSPAIRTPPRDAEDLDRLLQPRKYAREAAVAKRLPATAPRSNINEGDESDDEHLLNSSDIEEVPLEEDHYEGILLDQEGPTLGFGMISGKIGGLGPRLTLEGDAAEYRPITPPLPFTIGTLTPDMPLLVLGEVDDIVEDDQYSRPETPPFPVTIGDETLAQLPFVLGESNEDVRDQFSRPNTPPLPMSMPNHSSLHVSATILAEDEEAVSRLVSPMSVLPPDSAHTTISHMLGCERMEEEESDDDVVYLGERLGEAEDAFLTALSGVIGLDT